MNFLEIGFLIPKQCLAVIIGSVEVVKQAVSVGQVGIVREGKQRGGNSVKKIPDAPAALTEEGGQGWLNRDVVGSADAGRLPVSRARDDRRGCGVGFGEPCQEGRCYERHITWDDKEAWISKLAGMFGSAGDAAERAGIGNRVNEDAVVETIV